MKKKPGQNKQVIFFLCLFVFLLVMFSLAGEYGGFLVFWSFIGLIIVVIALTITIYIRHPNSQEAIKSISLGIGDVLGSLGDATETVVQKAHKSKSYQLLSDGSFNPKFKRSTIPQSMKESVRRDAGNRCQMWENPTRQGRCKVQDNHASHFHHINDIPGDHREKNLLYICANHHNIITKTIKWKELPKGSDDWKFTSLPEVPSHARFFGYMRRNDSQKLQKLDEKYFEKYRVKTKK